MTTQQRNLRNRKSRIGATTVEAAFTLPILFAFIFAGWELAHANMIRNSMSSAVYYAAREASLPGATKAKAIARGTDELSAVGVQGATFTVTPTVIEADTQEVTIDLTVPTSANSFGLTEFLVGRNFEATCTLSRELQPGTF